MTTEIAATDGADRRAAPRHSYMQILKSTSLIGISTVLSLVFSIFRTKALALLLGPSGVGLFGLYSLVSDLAFNIAGMGIASSGVRQIAESAGSGDAVRVARTVKLINLVSVALGLIGAVALAIFAQPIATLTFGSAAESGGVILLGVVVFLRLTGGAAAAIIQGTRQIGDLARMTVLAAVLNTAVTVPLIYVMGEGGIVPSLLAMALTSLLAALWYRRRIAIPSAPFDWRLAFEEAGPLLWLGFAFMASAMVSIAAAYVLRIMLLQSFGAAAAGLYQAAWSVSGLYVGIVLQAMGTDFYPRLTGVFRDNEACNRLVNEQTEISILLGAPGLIATIALAPVVMLVFYSPEFQPAVPMLRWICMGMLLRLLAWPLGYVLLAKGAQRMFFWSEVAAAIVQIALTWALMPLLGPAAAGVAFFGLYVWHGALVYFMVRHLSGFQWSAASIRLGLSSLAMAGLVLVATSILPLWPGLAVGGAASVVTGLFALHQLARLLPPGSLSPSVLSARFFPKRA